MCASRWVPMGRCWVWVSGDWNLGTGCSGWGAGFGLPGYGVVRDWNLGMSARRWDTGMDTWRWVPGGGYTSIGAKG